LTRGAERQPDSTTNATLGARILAQSQADRLGHERGIGGLDLGCRLTQIFDFRQVDFREERDRSAAADLEIDEPRLASKNLFFGCRSYVR
jgi:hypothetical protein